jgi:dTDP-4-dehydrorhamnose reductase
MKIILFGGSGLLGSKLLEINPNMISPSSSEVNIENIDEVYDFIIKNSSKPCEDGVKLFM